MVFKQPPIIYVVGYSNSGKTTLIEQLIRNINSFNIATIKFIHHQGISIEPAGKDSQRHRQAGAKYTFSITPSETALIINRKKRETIDSIPIYLQLPPEVLPEVDFILCEGLKEVPLGSKIILCCKTKDELQYFYNRYIENNHILVISGPISEILNEWFDLTILNTLHDEEIKKFLPLFLKSIFQST